MILTILERDDVPIHRISENFQHFAGKNPVVSMQNSRARFDDDSSHVVMMSHVWRPLHNPLPVECVVRGYLAGSGWKEYRESQSVCGEKLPAGLQLASQLPKPIFTPATKSEAGHDLNIDWKECCRILGNKIATRARDLSLQIYAEGRDHAGQRGIIVADTKFEFGIVEGELILIDECLTPDSSRFWPADQYAIGQSPPSFDKQFVRDYLETLDWRKTPPAPSLPKDVIAKTSAKYIEAFERLTSEKLL